jgi:putative methionine-R-sulfoxide reductase with GAF domain
MEDFQVSEGTKEEKYTRLSEQLKSVWNSEPDLMANLANTAAAIKQTFPFHWIGFYIVKANELVLGPFQGPVACTTVRHVTNGLIEEYAPPSASISIFIAMILPSFLQPTLYFIL